MFERESGDQDPQDDARTRAATDPHAAVPDHDPLAVYAEGAVPPPGSPESAQQAGNRPANQARQSDSASVARSDWRASDAATDFLGLDDAVFVDEALSAEFTPVTDDFAPTQSYSQAPAAEPETYAETAYPEASPYAEPRSGDLPVPHDSQPEGAGEDWLMGLDDAQAEHVGEGPDDPDLDLGQLDASYAEPDTKGKLGAWLVRGAAAAAVLAVVFTLVQLYSSSDEVPAPQPPTPIEPDQGPVARNDGLTLPDSSTTPDTARGDEVASGDTSAIPRDSGPRGSQRPAFDPAVTGESTADAAGRVIRDSQGDESVRADVAGEIQLDENGRPILPVDPTGEAYGVRDPFDDVALVDTPGSATQGPGTDPATPGNGPVVVPGELGGPGLGQGGSSSGGLRYASVADLSSVWDGTTIPIDSVEGTMRVVTPNVGRVRAVMHSGEIFEGRMYAVGEGKIWIDNGLGRMALTGSNVESVEHVLSLDGAPGLGEPGSQEYAGLPRVRAKAPGGVFFGKLIHEEEGRVTLITEEGARLTLENAQIDPAPSTKRVVVRGYDAASTPPSDAGR